MDDSAKDIFGMIKMKNAKIGRLIIISECEEHCDMCNVIYTRRKERFKVNESERRYIRQERASPNPPCHSLSNYPTARYRNMCYRKARAEKDIGMDHGRIYGGSSLTLLRPISYFGTRVFDIHTYIHTCIHAYITYITI